MAEIQNGIEHKLCLAGDHEIRGLAVDQSWYWYWKTGIQGKNLTETFLSKQLEMNLDQGHGIV